jgi:hypothetical protein
MVFNDLEWRFDTTFFYFFLKPLDLSTTGAIFSKFESLIVDRFDSPVEKDEKCKPNGKDV